jgi:hypothetical protein
MESDVGSSSSSDDDDDNAPGPAAAAAAAETSPTAAERQQQQQQDDAVAMYQQQQQQQHFAGTAGTAAVAPDVSQQQQQQQPQDGTWEHPTQSNTAAAAAGVIERPVVLGRLGQLAGECVVCREQDEARGPLAWLAHVQVGGCVGGCLQWFFLFVTVVFVFYSLQEMQNTKEMDICAAVGGVCGVQGAGRGTLAWLVHVQVGGVDSCFSDFVVCHVVLSSCSPQNT